MMKTNVVIYGRVSTTIQDYERQIVQLTDYCTQMSYNLVRTFEEKMSGTKRTRPGLTELLKFVEDKNNNVNMVIVDELSRLGRSIEIVNTIEKINSYGVNVFSKKESLNSLNPDGTENSTSMLIITITAGIVKQELNTNKYRQMSGRVNSVRNGKHWGGSKLPYGYDKDKKTKRLVINEQEKKIVNEVFNDFAGGLSYYTIVKKLINNETPTKLNKTWVISLIGRMLRNSIYIGQVKYKGEVYTTENLQIISIELWEKVQSKITNFNRPINSIKHIYKIDSSKIKCGVCGQSYTPVTRKDVTPFYMCYGKLKPGHKCSNHNINVNQLTGSLEHIIIKNFPEIIYHNIDNTKLVNTINNTKITIEQIEKQIKKTNRDESILIDLLMENPNITKDVFNQKLQLIQNKRDDLNKDLTNNNNNLTELENTLQSKKDIQKFKSDMVDNGLTRDVLNKFLTKVTIHPRNETLTTNKREKTIRVHISILDFEGYYLLNNYIDVKDVKFISMGEKNMLIEDVIQGREQL